MAVTPSPRRLFAVGWLRPHETDRSQRPARTPVSHLRAVSAPLDCRLFCRRFAVGGTRPHDPTGSQRPARTPRGGFPRRRACPRAHVWRGGGGDAAVHGGGGPGSKLLLEGPSRNTFAVCSCGADLRMGGVKAPGAHRPPGHAIGPRPSRAALLLPAAPAALLVVWRVSRQQCTGRGGADTLVVGRRHGSGRRRTATGTGLRTAPSILSRRTTGCRACSSSRPCSRGGWWAPRRAPSAPHLSTPPSTSAPAGSPAGAHGTAGGCAPAWPSRRCRSPLCRTRPWSQTSGEALGETTRCRGHLRQLENPRGEHWKIGTRAAARGVHQETVRRRAAARDGRPPPRA